MKFFILFSLALIRQAFSDEFIPGEHKYSFNFLNKNFIFLIKFTFVKTKKAIWVVFLAMMAMSCYTMVYHWS